MVTQLEPTDRTRLRRKKERGSFDVATIHAVLDEALSCHVGFAVDGRPWVVPTIHARIDDDVYLHGAVANHMLRTLSDGVDVCVTATLIDGLVLARSAFHHSMNYRSVMVFGRAVRVDEQAEKRRAMEALVEHVVRGRTADARPPTAEELRTTLVLRLPIVEASAKVRTGGPIDDDADMTLDIWAGVLPCAITFGTALADDGIAAPVPTYVGHYSL
jgi:nitroimidazol reductase NimA-like FMN-containing flavoprotein (pyridoxamine 5'-phosphate oxidase superfamily)